MHKPQKNSVLLFFDHSVVFTPGSVATDVAAFKPNYPPTEIQLQFKLVKKFFLGFGESRPNIWNHFSGREHS